MHVFKLSLCWHPLTALDTSQAIIQELAFITVQDLWALVLERDPAPNQDNTRGVAMNFTVVRQTQ